MLEQKLNLHNPNINLRTCYSFYQSIIKPIDLVTYCKNNNYKELVFTDVNNFSATTYLSELCKKEGIRFVLGMEVVIDDQAILLFPINKYGYSNLCIISSILNHESITPEWEEIFKYLDNFIIVVKSFHLICLLNSFKLKKENIFYSHKLLNLDNEQILFCHEVNYFESKDKKILDILNAVRLKNKIDVEDLRDSSDYKFLSLNDLQNSEWEEKYLNNLEKFYNKIQFLYSFQEIPIIEYALGKNSYPILKDKAQVALNDFLRDSKLLKDKKKYILRLNDELNTIRILNFSDYFLIVTEFISYARKENIFYGPGRGSAVGSLLCYLLKITKINPLKFNLLFERFMNLSRSSPPDIDIDIDSDERNKIINYIFDRFSVNNVSYIGTYSFVKAKTAIRDVGRVFNIDINYINLICKNLDSECKDVVIYYKNNLSKFYDIYPYSGSIEFLEIANKIIGLPRQFGIHPSGVILSKENIKTCLPLNITLNNHAVTQYDNLQLSNFKINKIDILGIKNISIIKKTIQSIKTKTQKELDLDNINFDDSKIFWEYRLGNTDGIFQLESAGMRALLRKIKVNSLNDIILAISLYRPGPLQQANELINRKHGKTKITYPTPELEPILKDTYGIIIFQEQIMQIAQVFAGLSLEEADNFRRGIAKKNHSIFQNYKTKFINQAIAKGNSKELSEQIFALIEKFADYGFNKSHAVGYGILGYQMFYLKVHYPLYFFCQLLNHHIDDVQKTEQYLKIFKQKYWKQYPIISFDIFNPSGEYQIIENKLQLGLFMIKGFGIALLKQLNAAKLEIQNFRSDFIKVIVILFKHKISLKNLQFLIIFNAFSSFKWNRTTMIQNLNEIKEYADIIVGQNGMINWTQVQAPTITVFTEDQSIIKNIQRKMLGFNY